MRFRLWTILWAFALLTSATTLFRWIGLFISCSVLALYAVRSIKKQKRITVFELLLISSILGMVLGFSLPPTSYFGSLHRRDRCLKQIQDVAFAVKLYRRRHRTLPRDFLATSGNELSWRILLLPDLGHANTVKRHGLNEEWKGAITPRLVADEPYDIRCLARGKSLFGGKQSTYFAVVGEETYWMDESSSYRDMQSDFESDTLMLIEANPRRSHWFEPYDLTMQEALELLTSVPDWGKPDGHRVNEFYPWKSFFYKPTICRNIAMADGSVKSLYTPLPEKLAKAILTDRQDEFSRSELERYARPRIDYGKVWGLLFFLAMVLLPALVKKTRLHKV